MLFLWACLLVIGIPGQIHSKIDTSFSRVSREKNGDTVGDIFVNLPAQSYYKIQFRFRGTEDDKNTPSTNEINYYNSGEQVASETTRGARFQERPNPNKIRLQELKLEEEAVEEVNSVEDIEIELSDKISSSEERRYSYKVLAEKLATESEESLTQTYPLLTTPEPDQVKEVVYAAASTTTSAPAYAARSSTAASTAARRTATTSAPAYSTPAPVVYEENGPVDTSNQYQVFSYRPQNSRYNEVQQSPPKILRFTYRKLDRNGKEIKDTNKNIVKPEASFDQVSSLTFDDEEPSFTHPSEDSFARLSQDSFARPSQDTFVRPSQESFARLSQNNVETSGPQKPIRKYTFRVIDPADRNKENYNPLAGKIKTLPLNAPIPVTPAPHQVSPRYPTVVPAYSTLSPQYYNPSAAPSIFYYPSTTPSPPYSPSSTPAPPPPPPSQQQSFEEEENVVVIPRGPKSANEPVFFIDLTNDDTETENNQDVKRLKRRQRPLKRRFRAGVRRPRSGIFGARSWSTFNKNFVL